MPTDRNALLMAAIDAARTRAYGTDDTSELGARRARALRYYLGDNVRPAPEGRSQVVDRSVYETIQTMLPALVRIFASSSEEVCRVVPVGPDDELAAEQTTAVLNHVVTAANQWEQIAADWIHDALLLSNGYAMAYWDESASRVRETYEGQTDDQLAMLLQDGVEIIEHSAYQDDEATRAAEQAWQAASQQAAAAGLPPPPQPQPVMLHDMVIERQERDGRVCIKVLPPEHCYVSADTPDWTLNECPYFEFRRQVTIAELRAMGLEVDEGVSDDDTRQSDEDFARDRFGEDTTSGDDERGVMRRVWARMIWIRADADGDGESRLYYVIAVGRTILFAEPTARIHVASMTPQPMPHRHIGMSVAEIVEDIQDIRTAVMRGGLDNLYLMNAGRHAVSSRVNLSDFLDARPGGVVRMLDDSLPTEGHIMPLVHPVAFAEIISSLQYFDELRQNRTGAARTVPGADAGVLNRTASGVALMQNASSMRIEHIARMMAPAVEALYSIVHELLAKHQQRALAIKLRGQWVHVDPQAWRTKRDMRISVGVGAGNKELMMAQLAQIFAAQMQLLPIGLAGPQQLHASVTEMARLAGFANAAKFWVDPKLIVQQQPPPSPEELKAQAKMQELQFTAQQDQLRFQATHQLERERMLLQSQVDKQREEYQARQKLLEAQQQSELERMRAQMQERAEEQRLAFERWRSELDAAVKMHIATLSKPEPEPRVDRIDEVIAAVHALREELNAPTEIVRDQNGRAVGIKRGNVVRTISRGPDGRAIGVI